MSLSYSTIASTTAAVLAGAALAAALTHSGPAGIRGAQGPAGQAGKTVSITSQAASTARFGVCWGDTWGTTSGGTSYVTTVSLASPVLADGVFECPQGLTFTSVVPEPQQTSAG